MNPPRRDIWDEPEMHRALATRDITTVYRLLCDAGLSQTQISKLTGQPQSEVSEILSGRRVLSYAVLERIADGLGIPRGHMGLAYADADGFLTPYPQEGDDSEDEEMRRRKMLADALTAAIGVAVFNEASLDRLMPLVDGPPDTWRIGLADLDAIRAATEAWQQLDHNFGGVGIHDAVSTSARRLTSALRNGAASAGVQRDLLIAVAQQHSLAGATAADAGLYDQARWHFHEGLTLAGQSTDLRMIAWMLDDIGRMELTRGEPNEALKAFQLASARMEPWPVLRSLMATCYAELGQAQEARKQLAAAAEPDTPANGLDGQSGHVLLRIGELPGAVAHYEISLASRAHNQNEDARARCMESAGLAAAQLRASNIAAGTQAAEQCLNLAHFLRSNTAKASLQPLYRAAIEKRDSTCQDLAQRVKRLVVAPA